MDQLSFEETGAYRLLLPAMAEDPRELQGLYEETVAKLAAYDEQYETELVRTLETFLDARRQRRQDLRKALHPPRHDPLPAGTGEGADRPRREFNRRPRNA